MLQKMSDALKYQMLQKDGCFIKTDDPKRLMLQKRQMIIKDKCSKKMDEPKPKWSINIDEQTSRCSKMIDALKRWMN